MDPTMKTVANRRSRVERALFGSAIDDELRADVRGHRVAALLADWHAAQAVGAQAVALVAGALPPAAMAWRCLLTTEPTRRLLELVHDQPPGGLPGRDGTVWQVTLEPLWLAEEAPERRAGLLGLPWNVWLSREELLAAGVATTQPATCRGATRRARRAARRLVARDEEARR
jgi:hypothetical protein